MSLGGLCYPTPKGKNEATFDMDGVTTSGFTQVTETAVKRRGRLPKAEEESYHDELLNHVVMQFMAIGYRSATMAGLAVSFGAAKSTLYRKYGSKASLLRAAMARAVPTLTGPLADVATEGRTPAEIIRDYGSILQAYHADPGIRAMWHAVSEAKDDLPELDEEIAQMRDEALTPIAKYLKTLIDAQRMSPMDCNAAAASFSELVTGGLTAFLGRPLRGHAQRQHLDVVTAFFLRGAAIE